MAIQQPNLAVLWRGVLDPLVKRLDLIVEVLQLRSGGRAREAGIDVGAREGFNNSRKVVGWAIADHLRAEIVVDALEMAIGRRRPEHGLIHHSDQGSQYVALVFSQRLRDAGLVQSMGSKGDCFDNAMVESFYCSLKKDLIYRRSWPTKAEARTAIFEHIEVFYNRIRLHSSLGMLSPEAFERLSAAQTLDTDLIQKDDLAEAAIH